LFLDGHRVKVAVILWNKKPKNKNQTYLRCNRKQFRFPTGVQGELNLDFTQRQEAKTIMAIQGRAE